MQRQKRLKFMQRCYLVPLVLLAAFFLMLPSSLSTFGAPPLEKNVSRACFSPGGQCLNVLKDEIAQAQKEILVMAYSFQSPAIAKALMEANARGVKVEVILDKSERQEGYTPAVMLIQSGISVYLDGAHNVMNNRFLIIDRATLATGSFSLNKASDDMNAENLLITQSVDLATLYRENWLTHKKHSEKF
jgi:phosphatidylserine/phosphatidylglycerophosphate/cardiolipin synthase-like enzyme